MPPSPKPRSATRSSELALLAAGLLALTVGVFADVLLPAAAALVPANCFTDLAAQFLPWRRFAASELRAGRLPLWNPHQFSGQPFLGAFESAVYYPPNWLHLALPPAAAVNLVIVLHVFLAGLFAALWARRSGASIWACALAGLSFMFGGPFFLHIYAGHLPVICALAWAPAIFACVDGWLDTVRAEWLLAGAAAAALQLLAGNPQYSFYTALGALALSAGRLSRAPRRAWGLAALAGAAAALSAAQLLPGLGVVAQSVRAGGVSKAMAAQLALPWRALLSAALPWGQPRTGFFWELSCFVGLSACACAAAGALRVRGRRGPLLALGAAGLALAVLPGTPLAPLVGWIPGAGMLRGSAKAAFLFALAAGQLGALGLDTLSARRRRLAPVVVALAAAELLAFAYGARDRCRADEPGAPVFAGSPLVRAGDGRLWADMTYHPNLAMSLGAHDAWGYSSLPLRRYARFMALTQGLPFEHATQYLTFRRDSPLLDLPRVAVVLLPGERGEILSRATALPRALPVERFRVLPSSAVWSALADPAFDPRREVLLEEDPGFAAEPDGGPEGAVSAASPRPGELIVDADLQRPALALITDAYARGWREETGAFKVLPADGAFQAVALPAGKRRLRLLYRPWEAAAGLALSALAWLAALGALLRYRRSWRWT